MPKLLDRLRDRRAVKKRVKAERAYQEQRHGIPARGSGAPRASSSAEGHFKGSGGG